MTRQATGPGRGELLLDRRPSFVAFKLTNFDIDDDHLKDQQTEFIDTEILPLLRSRDTIRARLTGITSRTGTFVYDLALGQRRADRVRSYLLKELVASSKAVPIDTASAGKGQAR